MKDKDVKKMKSDLAKAEKLVVALKKELASVGKKTEVKAVSKSKPTSKAKKAVVKKTTAKSGVKTVAYEDILLKHMTSGNKLYSTKTLIASVVTKLGISNKDLPKLKQNISKHLSRGVGNSLDRYESGGVNYYGLKANFIKKGEPKPPFKKNLA